MKTHEDREAYWTDLSDEEWNIIEPLVPAVKEGGRPADYSRREMVNGIRYLNRTGCAWRLLPHDLPPYRTVFAYFHAWQADGTWERIEAALRDRLRRQAGKKKAPTAAIVDSQSVKMVDQAGERGRDNGKQVTGRKRHLLVDTLGLILAIRVTAADVTDHAGARLVLQKLLTTIGFGWVQWSGRIAPTMCTPSRTGSRWLSVAGACAWRSSAARPGRKALCAQANAGSSSVLSAGSTGAAA